MTKLDLGTLGIFVGVLVILGIVFVAFKGYPLDGVVQVLAVLLLAGIVGMGVVYRGIK